MIDFHQQLRMEYCKLITSAIYKDNNICWQTKEIC